VWCRGVESRFVWSLVAVSPGGVSTSLQLHLPYWVGELFLRHRTFTLGARVLDLAARTPLVLARHDFYSIRDRIFLLSSFCSGDLRHRAPCDGVFMVLLAIQKSPPDLAPD